MRCIVKCQRCIPKCQVICQTDEWYGLLMRFTKAYKFILQDGLQVQTEGQGWNGAQASQETAQRKGQPEHEKGPGTRPRSWERLKERLIASYQTHTTQRAMLHLNLLSGEQARGKMQSSSRSRAS